MTTTTRTVNGNGQVLAPRKETVSIVTVTPTQAQKWLEGNVDNRKLRDARVVRLAGSIQREEWELTGDAIVFDSDGNLINGQHRLTAIVVADVPARLLILRGVAPQAQEVMDQGLSRTLGDQLMRRGVPYYTHVSSALGWLARMAYSEETGVAHYADPSHRPSLRQLLHLFEEYPELPDEAAKVGRHVNNLKVRGGATTAIYHRLKQIDAEEAEIFFERWLEGLGLKANDPVWRLREWTLADARSRSVKGRAPDYRYVAYVITAWNKWRDGEMVRQLKWTYTPSARMTWPIPH